MDIPSYIAGDLLDALETQLSPNATPGTEDYSKQAVLAFNRSQLLYDIKNIAYVEADVMPAKEEHERHQVFDIAEDGNVDRVTRVMDLAVGKCKEIIFPLTKTVVDEVESRDDNLKETQVYYIYLSLPQSFSKTTLDYLSKLIHEFIVYTVLVDWLSITDITNESAYQKWANKLSDVITEIGRAKSTKIRRARRTQTPF